MTDLDRRVAEWRGWTWDEVLSCWVDTDGVLLAGSATYSPSTNLLQAYQLWDEARPEGVKLRVNQRDGDDTRWTVSRWADTKLLDYEVVTLADLPHAITEAWVEAMEATCQKD